MKEKFIKALDKLRNKVTWLAQNNKLSEPQLKDYNFILQTFTEYYNYSEKRIAIAEEENGMFNMQLSQLIDKTEKLSILIKLSGKTQKFIDESLKMELHYLKNELNTNQCFNTNPGCMFFIQNHRVYKTLINADIETLKEFYTCLELRQKNPHPKWDSLLKSYHETYPYLSHYFKHIEKEGKFNPYIKNHLFNALDARYLWKN